MNFLPFAIAVLLTASPNFTHSASSSHSDEQIRAESLSDCLISSLSKNATIETPGQPEFHNDTARYSTLFNPSFAFVAKVANEQDLAASIKCASQTGSTFFITGPRHGFSEGLAKIKDGLEINTASFNSIDLDVAGNTVTIGGGITFQEVIDVAYKAKKILPTGSGSCVGFLGAGVGGGIGRLQGIYGLIIDNLLSVRIMLPNTTVVTASEDTNSELFWGIRGAGFNFGFILNATFRIYDTINNGNQLNADFLFPTSDEDTRSFYSKLAEVAKDMPAPLSIATGLVFNPDYNKASPQLLTTLTVNAVYAGPEAEGRRAVQFLADQSPIRQNISMVPWNVLIQAADFGAYGPAFCEKGVYRRSLYSVGFNVIDPEAQVRLTQTFKEMITKFPQSITSAAAMYLPATEAVMAVDEGATAYGVPRHLLGHMNFEITYTDNKSTDADVENLPLVMRDRILETGGTNGLKTYVGFGHGSEPLESIFLPEKLPRLAALKKAIDPSGLFNAYHPLPTEYP